MPTDLQTRYESLHREMVEQLERTVAIEKHWLLYTLLGWQHLATCTVSHYLLEIVQVHVRWPYALLWLVQVAGAIALYKVITRGPKSGESPLGPVNRRIWVMFMILGVNVAALNVLAGQPLFVFMPALAGLSAFAFTVMTTFLSRRFMPAGVAMFVTGVVMAVFPKYGFLIYGFGWLLVLQTLGIVFLLRRKRWLTPALDGPSSPRPKLSKAPGHRTAVWTEQR
jgi:hypothetical protein